jgi:hypothetical protein
MQNISVDFGSIYSYYELHLNMNLCQAVIYLGSCFAVAICDFDIFGAVTINIVFFGNIMPFNIVEFFWRYMWIYYFSHPDRKLSRGRKRACELRDRVRHMLYMRTKWNSQSNLWIRIAVFPSSSYRETRSGNFLRSFAIFLIHWIVVICPDKNKLRKL